MIAAVGAAVQFFSLAEILLRVAWCTPRAPAASASTGVAEQCDERERSGARLEVGQGASNSANGG